MDATPYCIAVVFYQNRTAIAKAIALQFYNASGVKKL